MERQERQPPVASLVVFFLNQLPAQVDHPHRLKQEVDLLVRARSDSSSVISS